MIKILQGLENNLSSQKVWNKKLFSKLTQKISHTRINERLQIYIKADKEKAVLTEFEK